MQWSRPRALSVGLFSDIRRSRRTNFKIFNAFADANEVPELPGSEWDLTFTESNGRTTVHVSIYNESLERLERMVAMGFTEGTAATFENLKELLFEQRRKHER